MKHKLTLEPASTPRMVNLCGPLNQHIQMIRDALNVDVAILSNVVHLTGNKQSISAASKLIESLYQLTDDAELTVEQIHLYLQTSQDQTTPSTQTGSQVINTPKLTIRPMGGTQNSYVKSIHQSDISFGLGPAGTGKTYLAVACAVEALNQSKAYRIILTRPAVEAGEKLGFLPGDLSQKVDPYLRPLYDALYEMVGFERVEQLIEQHIIEVAPLAFMRGRTLNDAFIILDEAQNCSPEQMKMFLTRMGFGSKMVITGDLTQTDLPSKQTLGLKEAINVLQSVKGISFTHFSAKDVVRHNLVQKIIQAYEQHSGH